MSSREENKLMVRNSDEQHIVLQDVIESLRVLKLSRTNDARVSHFGSTTSDEEAIITARAVRLAIMK